MGRPILYRTSKEFLMRFGLSDLDELPSLKEFEQLARAALGADEGIAPIEPDTESLDSTEAQAIPSNVVDESAPTSPHDSSKSADVQTEQKAGNTRAESATSNTGAGSAWVPPESKC